MERKGSNFDMPIDGVSDHYLTIGERVESNKSIAFAELYLWEAFVAKNHKLA